MSRMVALVVLTAAPLLLSACQSGASRTAENGEPKPRVLTSNPYQLEDHRNCLAAGHAPGTPAYRGCMASWRHARSTDLGAWQTAPALGSFF